MLILYAHSASFSIVLKVVCKLGLWCFPVDLGFAANPAFVLGGSKRFIIAQNGSKRFISSSGFGFRSRAVC